MATATWLASTNALTAVTALAAGDIFRVREAAGAVSKKLTYAVLLSSLATATLPAGTLTASAPFTVSQTWNDGAVTFVGKSNDFTDTASAAASLLERWRVGGSDVFAISKSAVVYTDAGASEYKFGNAAGAGGNGVLSVSGQFRIGDGSLGLWSGSDLSFPNNATISWSATSNAVAGSDLYLGRKAAASLQLGGADAAAPVAQTLRVQSVVAGTTDTAGAAWTLAGSQGTGTGAGGAIVFQNAPTGGGSGSAQNALEETMRIRVVTAGSPLVSFGGATSSFPALKRNAAAIDIRVADDSAYANLTALNFIATNGVIAAAAGQHGWDGSSAITSPSDGVIALFNNAQNDFGRLQFGGTTSSFPALKRSGTNIHCRLADDSDYTLMAVSALFISASTITFASSGSINSAGDGLFRFLDNAATGFASLLLGPSGTTYNRLKHNAAGVLELRLADDSAQATWDALAYRVAGTKVVGAQGASIADASGGAIIDAEARTAVNAVISRLEAHGLIATV